MGTDDFTLGAAIGLAAAAKLMRGRGGRSPHIETLRRWATRGCPLPDGRRLVLRTALVGAERLTMKSWVQSFEAARVAAGLRDVPPRGPGKMSTRTARPA